MRRGFLLTSFNAKKEPEKTLPSSNANTNVNANNDDDNSPPPKKRMTLEAPVTLTKQKQLEPVNKQPINVLAQMEELAKTMENYDQFKNEMERIQNSSAHTFVNTNELAGKMKEAYEKTKTLNALMPDGVNIKPIQKRIQLTIRNCREVFTKDESSVLSISTAIELVGIKWSLAAATAGKVFLGLYLFAEPPNGFIGNFRIDVDCRFYISNAVTGKDLLKVVSGIYTMNENTFLACGCPFMATLEDLLDPSNRFLTPEGNIEALADFTIKSATLDHLI